MEKEFSLNCKTSPSFSFSFNWGYQESLLDQENEIEQVRAGREVFSCLSGEHKPVYTLGKSIDKKSFLDQAKISSSEVVKVERGGKVMFHGPGQLTLYFIFNLKSFFKGPREYVDFLLLKIKDYIFNEHGLELTIKQSGLWLDKKKIGFMGIRITEGVVYHGVSLNYNTDLTPFINQSPCDISGSEVGNLNIKDADLSLEAEKINAFVTSHIDRLSV